MVSSFLKFGGNMAGAITTHHLDLLQTAQILGLNPTVTKSLTERQLSRLVSKTLRECAFQIRSPRVPRLYKTEATSSSSSSSSSSSVVERIVQKGKFRKAARAGSAVKSCTGKRSREERGTDDDGASAGAPSPKVVKPKEAVGSKSAKRLRFAEVLLDQRERGKLSPDSRELKSALASAGIRKLPPLYRYLVTPVIDRRCVAELRAISKARALEMRALFKPQSQLPYWDAKVRDIYTKGDGILTDMIQPRFISPQKGFGLIATKRIRAYTVLGLYTGKISRIRDVDPSNRYSFGFEELDAFKDFVIDAEKHGNKLRFVNTSKDMKSANINAIEYVSQFGVPLIIFVVGAKGIEAGEELTIFYGEDYIKKLGLKL